MTSRKQSQATIVRETLERGETVTPMTAMILCKSMRLAALVHILRHNEGVPITTTMRKNESTWSRYAEYSLNKK